MGLVRYVWEWCQRTSRAERVACCAALGALAVCAVLVGTLAGAPTPPEEPDSAPHEWNITRHMWLAKPEDPDNEPWLKAMLPLRLVIVQHTAGTECYKFADCAATIRTLQNYYLSEYEYDLPYNFLVGNEGRVYEGRGWSGQAAHTRTYNRCALGLGFTGDYGRAGGGTHATAQQLNHTHLLLQGGVRDGMMHARYIVLAARDLVGTHSPGENLYEALTALPHFVNDTQHYRGRTCEDIYAELEALDKALPDGTTPPSR